MSLGAFILLLIVLALLGAKTGLLLLIVVLALIFGWVRR
jgi:hypothetical protein